MVKKILLVSGALFLAGLITILFLFNWYLASFSREANLNKGEAMGQLINGFKRPYQEKYLTFLILGTDQ